MAVGRLGDGVAGGQGGPARRRPRHRADAPLRLSGPGPAGARGLGRRHRGGLEVRPRDLSYARAVRAVLSAIRLGHACYQAVTSQIAEHRNVADRSRHRARKSKSPSAFDHAGPAGTATRTAPAVITMANTPA